MDAKKIAKTSGKVAGITILGVLTGMAAVAQAQAEAELAARPRRPFSPRFSDEFDTKAVVLTSGNDSLTIESVDGEFVVVESTLKGCKPGRVVEIKDSRVEREIMRALQQNVYMRESVVRERCYLLGSNYEPLLFARESKDGEMVPTFMDKGWKAELLVEAAN